MTPVLSNFMDPTVCYLPNGYQSYYYGGEFNVPKYCWNLISFFVILNYSFCDFFEEMNVNLIKCVAAGSSRL